MIINNVAIYYKAKLAAEFKEKTIPNMFGVLQKHIKDGHFLGSDGVSISKNMARNTYAF